MFNDNTSIIFIIDKKLCKEQDIDYFHAEEIFKFIFGTKLFCFESYVLDDIIIKLNYRKKPDTLLLQITQKQIKEFVENYLRNLIKKVYIKEELYSDFLN